MIKVSRSDQPELQSQNSEMHQMNVEIDTGAGCNAMPLYKVKELFGQEWLVQRLSPPTVRIKAYGDQEVKVLGSITLYRVTWQVKTQLASQY